MWWFLKRLIIRFALPLCAFVAGPGLAQVLINGAGATFPYPIYARWFDEFHRRVPAAQLNYQSIGSGGGVRQLVNGIIDFGASDCPLTDEQLRASPVPILHFPTVLGAVAPIYNIPGVAAELRFTPEALAGIYLGTIGKWNDPELKRSNPGAALPAADIVPVHRSDGSGTTYVLTDFLSKTSSAWKSRIGAGMAIRWPAGLGAKGNEGVAGIVKQTPNSIGYVELAYALHTRLRLGRVRNAAGEFARAGAGSITTAAWDTPVPDDFRVSITNAPGRGAYPLVSYTWLLVPARIDDPAKRELIVAFLEWMYRNGQPMAEPLGYAPLPPSVAAKALKAVSRLRHRQVTAS
jgi:phosphate transport system substrate-binding protein